MARWVTQDRIICLGDTAYCPTSLTGMGAPLAILGAYTLAGELSILEDDATRIPQAFSRYENIYREHVEKAQEIPLGSLLPGIALPSSWLGVTVLRTFLACLARLCSTPWIADRLRGDGKGSEVDQWNPPEYARLREQGLKNEARVYSRSK